MSKFICKHFSYTKSWWKWKTPLAQTMNFNVVTSYTFRLTEESVHFRVCARKKSQVCWVI